MINRHAGTGGCENACCLKIEHLSVKIGTDVILDDINLHMHCGQIVALIGPNGSGKTTTINMISGVVPADSGSIVYKGTEVSGRSTDSLAKMGIIRTFQNIKLFMSMSALENTMVGGHSFTGNTMAKSLLDVRAHFREEKLLKEAAEEAMEYVGLYSVRNENVRNLPYGKQKMLELARALMSKPQLLLLDEHTAALDPATAAKVLELSDKIVEENGLTALMITHNMKDAIAHGNRLIMMNEGHIILDIAGEEKKKLTKKDLLDRFAALDRKSVV